VLRPVDVTLVDGDAAWVACGADEALVDPGPVEVCASHRVPVGESPADRPALIRTTDLPALQLPPIDVLAVERDPARPPSSAGNEAVLDARPIEPSATDRRRSRRRTSPGREVRPVQIHRRGSAGARPSGRDGDEGNERHDEESDCPTRGCNARPPTSIARGRRERPEHRLHPLTSRTYLPQLQVSPHPTSQCRAAKSRRLSHRGCERLDESLEPAV
jgi:hypothetical protein